ncbi:mannose-ethanolamine phosphotransferase gpi13 [Coemansia sp. RSA 1933]|nr:mannose-ethanolamine phosphotransferase gpi13 [Coemansia sp. RSA 1933]
MATRESKRTGDPDTRPKPLAMRGHWTVSLLLLACSAAAFWLFSRGFLLTRMVLSDHSQLAALPFAGVLPGAGDAGAECAWYPAKFDRAVVLVIDALRVDFATWSTELEARFGGPGETGNSSSSSGSGPGQIKPYHNKLPVIHRLNERRPEQSMLYRFRADPPTTTLQRLKGLTTGQLPTFIDAGSNFAGSAIEEDNWLQALRRASVRDCKATASSSTGSRRNLVFLGDDTWMSLFPDELSDTCAAEANDTAGGGGSSSRGWTRSRPFPSLNVWDIDTVDDGVLARLPLFLLPPEAEEHAMAAHKAAEVRGRREAWRRLVRQKEMLQHPDLLEGPGGAMESGRVGGAELHRDWDVLIAHCLGVDHCGHRYGPDHHAIGSKLAQMNAAIEYIVEAIDQADRSTALFVFGDHGMDPKGDHGGDSPREVDAALWIYANKRWNSKGGAERAARVVELSAAVLENSASGLSLDQEIKSNWWLNTHLTDDYRQASGQALLAPPRMRSVPQIDFVATLSLALGLPIPFNNLGAAIPEMFASDYDDDGGAHGGWGLLRALRLNAAQTMRYLTTYMATSQTHGFSDDAIRAWNDMYERAETSHRELAALELQFAGARHRPQHIIDFEEKVAAEYHAFLRLVLGTLWQMWAQFDAALILSGLCIMALVLAALVLLYLRARRSSMQAIVGDTWKGCLGGSLAAMTVARALCSAPFVSTAATQMSRVDVSVAGLATGLALAFCVQLASRECPAWFSFAKPTVQTIPAHSLLNGAAVTAAAMHSLAFTSNSFTFSEDSVVHHLLQSILFIAACVGASVQIGSDPSREKQRSAGRRAIVCALVSMALNRISLYSTVCREEQLPGGCIPTFYGAPSASISGVPLAVANLAMVWLVPYVVLRFLKRSHSHRAMIANLWIGIGMRISMAMAAVYWILDSVDGNSASGTALPKSPPADGSAAPSDWSELRIVLARMAAGVAVGGGFSAWLASPFCLDVAISDLPEAPSSSPKRRPAKPQNPPRQAAVILGFGNAFGAAYLAFVTVVFCVLYTLQQPMGGIMLSVLLVGLLFSVELFDALRDALSTDAAPTPSLIPAQVAVMALLAYHGYFATGHQFTLVSIQWSTAFVGIREMRLLVCGAIVLLNTLGPFVLAALFVPLATLWNESLGAQVLRLAPDAYLARLTGAGALYAAYNLLVTTGSAVFAAWFRRHLMVWKVFAPRFMFAVPVFLLNIAVALCIAVGFAAARTLAQGLTIANAQALVAQKIQSRR